jgi:hypothetical protein
MAISVFRSNTPLDTSLPARKVPRLVQVEVAILARDTHLTSARLLGQPQQQQGDMFSGRPAVGIQPYAERDAAGGPVCDVSGERA